MALPDQAKTIAASDDEFMPAAIADRLLAGESPVRAGWEHRGLTRDGAAAGLPASDLALNEAGQLKPSRAVGKVFGAAMGVGLDDLI